MLNSQIVFRANQIGSDTHHIVIGLERGLETMNHGFRQDILGIDAQVRSLGSAHQNNNTASLNMIREPQVNTKLSQRELDSVKQAVDRNSKVPARIPLDFKLEIKELVESSIQESMKRRHSQSQESSSRVNYLTSDTHQKRREYMRFNLGGHANQPEKNVGYLTYRLHQKQHSQFKRSGPSIWSWYTRCCLGSCRIEVSPQELLPMKQTTLLW